EKMLLNNATKRNMQTLINDGVKIMSPDTGMLAEGYTGKGRLPKEEEIIEWIINKINSKKDLVGKKVVISAGSTIEPIDPVRYISNYSSGKMGYALAEAAFERGASVTLVSGPTNLLATPGVKINRIKTTNKNKTNKKIKRKMNEEFKTADNAIKAAAVSDYHVAKIANNKNKKTGEKLTLELVQNPDILKGLGSVKEKQILVGFAAETNN